MYNPLQDNLPSEIDFSLVSASFVERNGFMTITDKKKQKELGLPRWTESPIKYFIDKEGKVWARHFTQTRRHLKFQSILELIESWKVNQEEYLHRNGYTITDVSN
jgi:hypothetical protein